MFVIVIIITIIIIIIVVIITTTVCCRFSVLRPNAAVVVAVSESA